MFFHVPVIKCPHFRLDNGQVLLSNATLVGSQAEFRCFAGYELRGSRTRQCQENGKWSGITTTCNNPGY